MSAQSHCWGDEEMTFKDFRKKRNCIGAGYRKVVDFCTFARTIPYEQESWDNRARLLYNTESQGIQWAWVDTVCIDKTSSTHLSEALNSMYRQYSLAQICLAHIADVRMEDDTEAIGPAAQEVTEHFKRSRWFTRGFTLQELIAPSQVVFVDRQWRVIGTKNRLFVDTDRLRGLGPLTEQIVTVTGIPKEVLNGINKNHLHRYSVAKRMSWAAKRQTTRVEDMAYCLLGIFDINMSPLYGEGRDAFRRLQEEILHHRDSDSILARALRSDVRSGGLHGSDMIARSPAVFAESGNIIDAGGSLGSNLSREGTGWALRTPTLFQHRDGTHYICRLRCGKPDPARGLIVPSVMILQVMNCSHLRRAFDGQTYFEDDIANPESYTLVEDPQTFYVHSASEDHLYCIGTHAEGQSAISSYEKGGLSQDAHSLRAMFRDRALNAPRDSPMESQSQPTGLRSVSDRRWPFVEQRTEHYHTSTTRDSRNQYDIYTISD